MQDQLKSNIFSTALQGQQQKKYRGGKEKTTLSSPPKNKVNRKSPPKKPKPKIKQLIRELLSVDEFQSLCGGLCWLIMCVAYL